LRDAERDFNRSDSSKDHEYRDILISVYILVATEVLGSWEKKRKKDYPGARP
jgi:hypothetical protein